MGTDGILVSRHRGGEDYIFALTIPVNCQNPDPDNRALLLVWHFIRCSEQDIGQMSCSGNELINIQYFCRACQKNCRIWIDIMTNLSNCLSSLTIAISRLFLPGSKETFRNPDSVQASHYNDLNFIVVILL